jgi:4-hydroxybenzoate polyprenyltransferase
MLKKIRACLELMRPANIVTAFADILAGFSAVGGAILLTSSRIIVEPSGLFWLLIATMGLYSGGIVFNDVFDAELDAKERPERAIPSGRISKAGATLLGVMLFLLAVVAAYQVSLTAVVLSLFIILCALIYDAKAKHSSVAGPLFMGLCRGGNLLLGGSLLPEILLDIWFIALIPVIYISAITLISRGEVAGGKKKHGYLALMMILIVIISVPLLSLLPSFNLLPALPFLILFGAMVIPAFAAAAKTSKAGDIKKAVKRGVVSLVIFNSVLAAGFSGLILGLIVLILFPVSVGLAKLFAVT